VGRDIIKRKAPWIKTILPFLKSPKSLRERTISLDFDIYDYINSDAYFYPSANGNYGGIYINKDRDSNEYEELRNEILDNLLNIKDPDNGKAIINRAWKKEELYTGPFLDEIFDIVFEAHSDYYVSTENDDLLNFPNKIVTEREVSQHEIDGILIAQGPSIACSQAESNIMNVMPTILYSMDLPIPNDCDGQVIEKIFTTDYLRNNQLRFTDAIGFDVANSEENEDDAKIIERLKGLGYL
jgi:predicted AlkP superfamily phosphohydrolase/phosphomutase